VSRGYDIFPVAFAVTGGFSVRARQGFSRFPQKFFKNFSSFLGKEYKNPRKRLAMALVL